LLGKLGSFQPSDKFLGLTREHGAADYFDPTELFFGVNSIFEKHFVILDESNLFSVFYLGGIKLLKK
jgi:hypothetical protein